MLQKFLKLIGVIMTSILLCPSWIHAHESVPPVTRTFKINQQYLNFPIDEQMEDAEGVSFVVGKDTVLRVGICLAQDEPDYWVFKDVSAYYGKKLKLVFDKEHPGSDKIFLSDKFVGQDSLYQEKFRPQYHFSSRRGWINDPNGLIWYKGEYHLFYQHNPYNTRWGNMHWGHAVSKDLLHWTELNDALYPDRLGTIFSGSAIADVNNTAGFGENALIAAFTAHGEPDVQCIAYSHDNGRTFTKYEGNPVIDSFKLTGGESCRDPNIFWYEPLQKWVMIVHERCSYSFYHSDNLKDWTYQSSVRGFYECPDIFELPVDGDPQNTKWVIMGASGTYMIGSFDGYKFTPEHGKYYCFWGNRQAGQTYNNVPDGRTIHMGWALNMSPEGAIYHAGTPFSQHMAIPVELSLKTTRDGLRLFSAPIREVNTLHGKKYECKEVTAEEANQVLKDFKGDLFHLKVDLEMDHVNKMDIFFRGSRLLRYDLNFNQFNGVHYVAEDMGNMRFQLEILVDRTSMELFIDGGKLYIANHFQESNPEEGLLIMDNDGLTDTIKIHSLELYEMNSIWN